MQVCRPCRYSATKATLVGIGCTFFEAFNVPVFWPILLLYFITLFCITMKRQIKVRHAARAGLPKNFGVVDRSTDRLFLTCFGASIRPLSLNGIPHA